MDFKLSEDQKITTLKENVKHFIAVLSGKGGVGKTTVSVNLATALAESGYNVGILDIDIHGPDIVRMLGGNATPLIDEDERIVPAEILPNLKALSISMMVEEGKPIIWRGPLKHSAIKQFLGDTNWGKLDFMIFDLPPGTGDEALSLFQTLGQIDGVIMVTTPQKVALDDVRRAIAFVHAMNQKVLGIVENMSYMRCKDEVVYPFGKGGADALAQEYSVPVLGRIPMDPKALELLDEGKPITLYYRESEIEQAFRTLAENVAKAVEK
ncbi:MAG: Mrp/NBP35 family ATP-binding protein [Fervidobacterium sp.]|uniref:Mrp/NBP35 family ATP-binding protein n=1 Tax=Fervidobacterium sp. TaxID=1871331 RepID=UPI004049925B